MDVEVNLVAHSTVINLNLVSIRFHSRKRDNVPVAMWTS